MIVSAASTGKVLLVLLAVLFWACPAARADVTLLDFSSGFSGSSSSLNFNGNAVQTGSVARLTNGGSGQIGTFWSTTQVEVRNFEIAFSFQLDGVTGFADGVTFSLQRSGDTILGCGGGCLGYGQIGNSIAIKFDTHPHSTNGTTGLFVNGAIPSNSAPESIDMTSSGINLRNGNIFEVTLTYDGTTLHQEIVDTVTSATFTHDYLIDIPEVIGGNAAYAGFTGATGGQTSIQDILTWT